MGRSPLKYLAVDVFALLLLQFPHFSYVRMGLWGLTIWTTLNKLLNMHNTYSHSLVI